MHYYPIVAFIFNKSGVLSCNRKTKKQENKEIKVALLLIETNHFIESVKIVFIFILFLIICSHVECHIEKPPLCPTPEVPENGGLGCVTVGKRYFCKPMCNHVSTIHFIFYFYCIPCII